MADDCFFGGRFELPAERLAGLFDAATGLAAWDTLVAGFAPGGRLAVWVAGGGVSTELCYFAAPAVDVDWGSVQTAPGVSKSQWVEQSLNSVLGAEGRALLASEGPCPERWDSYRERWHWHPLLLTKNGLKGLPDATLVLNAFNGETELLTGLGESHLPIWPAGHNGRAAPLSAVLRFTDYSGNRFAVYIDFDEYETFAAWRKLANRPGASASLSLQIDVTDLNAGVRLYFCDDKYSLELLAADVKLYRAD